MDRDVLSSPASVNYRTRCIVNIAGSERNRLQKCVGVYDLLPRTRVGAKGWTRNKDVTLPFVRLHINKLLE